MRWQENVLNETGWKETTPLNSLFDFSVTTPDVESRAGMKIFARQKFSNIFNFAKC